MPINFFFRYIIAITVTISSLSCFGQDAPMSQYYSNLVVLNPAFAGTTGASRFNFFYRNQWLRTNASFHSFGAAYDMSLTKYNSGVGAVFTNEFNGAYVNPTVDFIYSYMVEILPEFIVSMGVQAGVTQKYLLSSNLVFHDKSEVAPTGFGKIIPDFAIGVVGFYRNYYGGFSLDHIAKPPQGFSGTISERINRKYTMFVGYLHYYDTRLFGQQRVLSPNILIQIQGFQQNINWGFSFQYDNLVGGVWVRHNIRPDFDAMVFSAGYKTKSYKFAYSYDMNLGKKTLIPLGAHEVSFTMLIETHRKKKFKAVKSPTFFR